VSSEAKDIYIVAASTATPPESEQLREAFEGEDVTFEMGSDFFFAVEADGSRVEVRFETREPLGVVPDLLQGTSEAKAKLEAAQGFYRVRFAPGQPQPSVAVFEALWVIRTLLELVEAVVVDTTAYKLHAPQDIEELTELDFDIRDHITVHAMGLREDEGAPLWVHTHGMAKFAAPDVEMFHIGEDDLPAAETFFNELCVDVAFGQGPSLRTPISTSVGMRFQLLPSDEGRATLYGIDPELYDGHMGPRLTVVGADGRHALGEILANYRERFEAETPEEADALQQDATRLLPSFKARFFRRGLMEPLTFLVRAPFEVHPQGEASEPDEEQLWVEVVSWEDSSLIGKLVDGGQATTEWRKGAHVELDDDQINAVSVSRAGRTLDEEEVEQLLLSERPS
jgi:hypothetical protein